MTIEQRKTAFLLQNPLLCLESPMERALHNILKTAGVCPVMQYPVGNYWIDFAFPKQKIAIEYDGKIHETKQEYDKNRDLFLKNLGWTVIRITSAFFKKSQVLIDDEGEETKLIIEVFAEELRKKLKEIN